VQPPLEAPDVGHSILCFGHLNVAE
jgi:hypothetical protein